jgi:hypothetical protein
MSSNIQTNIAAIPVLPERLGWNNLITFTRVLMDYAASKNTAVGTSLAGGFDFDPLDDLTINATPAEIRICDKDEKAHQKYREARISICLTLHQSLEPDLQNRINMNPIASSYKSNGEAGALWRFIKGVIQGI